MGNKNTVYLSIELSSTGAVSVDDGRIITRLFREEKQICIIEIKQDANIIIDQGSVFTILEWNGEKFICR